MQSISFEISDCVSKVPGTQDFIQHDVDRALKSIDISVKRVRYND